MTPTATQASIRVNDLKARSCKGRTCLLTCTIGVVWLKKLVNFGDDRGPGGGWQRGCLCRRQGPATQLASPHAAY